MYSENPWVTLITVSFNSAVTIKDTIESILSQSYNKIEYIIVDGLSKDNTKQIVNSYSKAFKDRGFKFNFISEKDRGLYDAMNKGVLTASGEIIGIINSDDYYSKNIVIEEVVNLMIKDKSHCLYADLQFVDHQDTSKIVRVWKAKKGDFRFGWNPPHPTTFISRETYLKFGLYRIDYKISSDFDLLYRIIHKGGIKASYLSDFIVKMRTGGKSTSGLKSNIIANKEIYRTLKENNQKFIFLIMLLRLSRKVKQFVYKKVRT
jgi:glycosyltransferase involved in cell wall biosynthesis